MPVGRQAIIRTNVGVLLIWPSGTYLSEIEIKIPQFSSTKNDFENVVCKMSAILSRSQCVKAKSSGDYTDLLWCNNINNFILLIDH